MSSCSALAWGSSGLILIILDLIVGTIVVARYIYIHLLLAVLCSEQTLVQHVLRASLLSFKAALIQWDRFFIGTAWKCMLTPGLMAKHRSSVCPGNVHRVSMPGRSYWSKWLQ